MMRNTVFLVVYNNYSFLLRNLAPDIIKRVDTTEYKNKSIDILATHNKQHDELFGILNIILRNGVFPTKGK